MYIHNVPDDERTALVPAQDPGRERPHRTEVLGVILVDLAEFAISRVCIVAGRHDPLIGVFRERDQRVIGAGLGREARQYRRYDPETEWCHRLHSSPLMIPLAAIPEHHCGTGLRSVNMRCYFTSAGCTSSTRLGQIDKCSRWF